MAKIPKAHPCLSWGWGNTVPALPLSTTRGEKLHFPSSKLRQDWVTAERAEICAPGTPAAQTLSPATCCLSKPIANRREHQVMSILTKTEFHSCAWQPRCLQEQALPKPCCLPQLQAGGAMVLAYPQGHVGKDGSSHPGDNVTSCLQAWTMGEKVQPSRFTCTAKLVCFAVMPSCIHMC